MGRTAALLALALGISGCTCGADARSGPAPEASPPLDAEPRLDTEPLEVRALDASRAVAITRPTVDEPVRVALVQDGVARWSRPLPCDAARAGILDASADDELVIVRCPVGPEPGVVRTLALATGSGELRWSADGGSAAGLRGGDLETLRVAGSVVGAGGPAGLEARDPGTGELRWARAGAFYAVAIAGDMVLALSRSGDDLLLDAQTGEPVRPLSGRVVGVLDAGACVLREHRLEWYGRRETRPLAHEGAISALVDAGMRPDDWGLRIECGRRGSSVVVLADAGPYNLIAIIPPDGSPRIVRLPRTSGPPVVEGWDRELPRHVALVTEPRTLVVVDLDDARVAWTLDVPFPRDSQSAGELLLVRARAGDRFLLSNDLHLFAVDGVTGQVAADERALAEGVWWLDLPRAVAGDVVWAARTEDGVARVEPARFTADGPLATDWATRRLETVEALP